MNFTKKLSRLSFMKLYKFISGRRNALTKDKSGSNLPGGKWTFESEIGINAGDGPRIGASSADILAGVERDGYFTWPVKKA